MNDQLAIFLSQLWSVLLPVLLTALTTVFVLLIKAIGKLGAEFIGYAKAYMLAKLDQAQYQMLRTYAYDVVTMLMQHPAYKDLSNEDKKTMAVIKITDYAISIGLPFTKDQVSEVVEAVLKQIKILAEKAKEATEAK